MSLTSLGHKRYNIEQPTAAGAVELNEIVNYSCSALGANLTRYLQCADQLSIAGGGTADAAEAKVILQYLVTRAGTISNLMAFVQAAAGAGQSYIYTLRQNGVATAVTVTISGAVQVTNIDAVNTINTVVGDRLTVEVISSAAAAVTDHGVSFLQALTSISEQCNYSTGTSTVAAGATSYLLCDYRLGAYSGAASATETEREVMLFTKDANINNLVAKSYQAAGAGQSFTYTVRVDGAPSALTCSHNGAAAITSNNTANTVAVTAGQYVTVQVVASAGAAATTHTASYQIT